MNQRWKHSFELEWWRGFVSWLKYILLHWIHLSFSYYLDLWNLGYWENDSPSWMNNTPKWSRKIMRNIWSLQTWRKANHIQDIIKWCIVIVDNIWLVIFKNQKCIFSNLYCIDEEWKDCTFWTKCVTKVWICKSLEAEAIYILLITNNIETKALYRSPI